jgi:hypothetical protein
MKHIEAVSTLEQLAMTSRMHAVQDYAALHNAPNRTNASDKSAISIACFNSLTAYLSV